LNSRNTAFVAATIAVALPLLAAEKLGARVGLWENTITTNLSGLAIPADALAKVPAAQRAQMEQMMKQIGAQGPRTITERACITEKELSEGAFRKSAERDDRSCKHTVITSTSKRQESTFACTARDGSVSNGHMVIDAIDDTHLKGALEMKSPQANIDMKFDSKWLGANCGDTK
jgi:hypothetical protein